jgi:hypothetical protein
VRAVLRQYRVYRHRPWLSYLVRETRWRPERFFEVEEEVAAHRLSLAGHALPRRPQGSPGCAAGRVHRQTTDHQQALHELRQQT